MKNDEYGTYSDIKSFKTEEDDTIEVGKKKYRYRCKWKQSRFRLVKK